MFSVFEVAILPAHLPTGLWVVNVPLRMYKTCMKLREVRLSTCDP